MTSTEQTGAAIEMSHPPHQSGATATNPVTATAPAVKTPAKRVISSTAAKTAPAVKAVSSTARTAAAKASVKTAPKAVTQPVVKAPAKKNVKTVVKVAEKVETKVAKVPEVKLKSDKLLKDKKPKLVRDSFTIPKLEYLLLDQLKQRSGTLGTSVKKSELIRAGIKALAAMADANFLAAVKAVPIIKTGRPVKN